MDKNEKPTEKKPLVDPTDPRQAAFIAGGITGAVAGATLGSVAGPVGAVAGATVGGFAGAKTAERISIDTAAEEYFWRDAWKDRPYASSAKSYDDYAPAYRAGYELPDDILEDGDATFESSEPMLRKNYELGTGSRMPWESARPAAKDAFERVRRNRIK